MLILNGRNNSSISSHSYLLPLCKPNVWREAKLGIQVKKRGGSSKGLFLPFQSISLKSLFSGRGADVYCQ